MEEIGDFRSRDGIRKIELMSDYSAWKLRVDEDGMNLKRQSKRR